MSEKLTNLREGGHIGEKCWLKDRKRGGKRSWNVQSQEKGIPIKKGSKRKKRRQGDSEKLALNAICRMKNAKNQKGVNGNPEDCEKEGNKEKSWAWKRLLGKWGRGGHNQKEIGGGVTRKPRSGNKSEKDKTLPREIGKRGLKSVMGKKAGWWGWGGGCGMCMGVELKGSAKKIKGW